jgi:N-acetylglucosamine-6-phosphate deacetylase
MAVMSLAITNGIVLHHDRLEASATLVARGPSIQEIVSGGRPSQGDAADATLDAAGCYVLPGLVDIHTHGMRDVMVDADDIHRYARHQVENGVTACLPTLAANPAANIARMKRILAETKEFSLTPNLVGFRPEIMYLVDASAGPSASLAKPDPATTEAVWEASGGRIRIWDISPEIEGALPFISWCERHGIVTSMAHSSATIEQVRAAVDAGMSLVTHFYDLFPIAREIDEGVYPAGVTDWINIEDRLTTEIIPDCVHVHPLLVEKTLRCKGLERVAFITDSLKGSGNPPGRYEGIAAGEPVEVTADRGIRRISDGILSGSTLTMIGAFRNAVRVFGRSVAQASALCSRTPARILGMRNKGHLAAGMDADVILLTPDLELQAVVVRGEVAWRRQG